MARLFDLNAQIELSTLDITRITPKCTGRYSKYLFGDAGGGHLGVLDVYGNFTQADAVGDYSSVAEGAKAGPLLKDGTQYVFCHNLGEHADIFRFNPQAFTFAAAQQRQHTGSVRRVRYNPATVGDECTVPKQRLRSSLLRRGA